MKFVICLIILSITSCDSVSNSDIIEMYKNNKSEFTNVKNILKNFPIEVVAISYENDSIIFYNDANQEIREKGFNIISSSEPEVVNNRESLLIIGKFLKKHKFMNISKDINKNILFIKKVVMKPRIVSKKIKAKVLVYDGDSEGEPFLETISNQMQVDKNWILYFD